MADSFEALPGRLPTHVVPTKYKLWLKPDLDAYTFEGTVDVSLTVQGGTKSVQMHSKELEIQSASVAAGDKTLSGSVSVDNEAQIATVTFEDELTAGQDVVLSMAFTGILNDKMAGFYRSSYKTPEGEDRVMAVTQFEATDARQCFPCWDEPAMKATFEVSLTVPEDRVALSNMPVVSEDAADDGWKCVSYAETPKMSTYLLAFVVGEFDYVSGHTARDVEVRVYTPVGEKEKGRFALDVGIKALDLLEEYFGSPYPLPKMDMIAINDFAAGAMENWGLVTYRSALLLVNPPEQYKIEGTAIDASVPVTPMSLLSRCAYVVNHELSHQWFGNLVTMEWWQSLWLNEGFATYVGWWLTDQMFPEMLVWEQFVTGEFASGHSLDALESSHPIEVEIEDANAVDEIFDAVSYCKGACVIRMLVSALGEASFKEGMRLYLERHTYSNAKTNDLWDALGSQSGVDVAALMATWTLKMGYPVVSVARTSDTTIKVSQQRFLATGAPETPEDTVWKIPLRILTAESPSEPIDFTLETAEAEIEVPAGAWVKLNAGRVGFFRVAYDAASVELLAPAIPTLSTVDRVGLTTDAFALARAGYASTAAALNIIKSLAGVETEYLVWSDVSTSVGALGKTWMDADEELKNQIKAFSLSLFGGIAENLGWNKVQGESFQTGQLRPIALARAIKSGHAGLLEEARTRCLQLVVDGDENAIEPDLRAGVFAAVLSTADEGDETFHSALIDLYTNTESPDIKTIIHSTIGSTNSQALAQKTLDWALSDAVRDQDLFFVINSLCSNKCGRALVWTWISENWNDITAQFTGSFLLARIVKIAVSAYSDAEFADATEAFFNDQTVPPNVVRPLAQALESCRANASWRQRDDAVITEWFQQQQQQQQ